MITIAVPAHLTTDTCLAEGEMSPALGRLCVFKDRCVGVGLTWAAAAGGGLGLGDGGCRIGGVFGGCAAGVDAAA
jgi:hypothetical protein